MNLGAMWACWKTDQFIKERSSSEISRRYSERSNQLRKGLKKKLRRPKRGGTGNCEGSGFQFYGKSYESKNRVSTTGVPIDS